MVLEMCLNIIWRHLDATLVTDTWWPTDLAGPGAGITLPGLGLGYRLTWGTLLYTGSWGQAPRLPGRPKKVCSVDL